MPDSQTPTSGSQTSGCVGFDYGTKRIGVAIGNSAFATAKPLCVVRNNNGTPDWDSIDAIIEQWEPAQLVVGWPLNPDGEVQELCNHVNGFIKKLIKRYAVPVAKVDERFSSNAAQQHIRQMRQSGQRQRKSRHEDIDSVAAALLLETWFSAQASM